MTQIASPSKVFSIVVKAKAEGDPSGPGLTLECEIPKLSAKFPVKLTRVQKESYDAIKVGNAYNVELRRGTLKQGKEGHYDGDYFWDWLRVVPPPAPGVPGEAPAAAPGVAPPSRGAWDSRGESIERQVALKEARIAAEWLMTHAGPLAEGEKRSDLYLASLAKAYRFMVKLLAEEVLAAVKTPVPSKELCPFHKAAYQSRTGKTTGGVSYEFWVCPEKVEPGTGRGARKDYCPNAPGNETLVPAFADTGAEEESEL